MTVAAVQRRWLVDMAQVQLLVLVVSAMHLTVAATFEAKKGSATPWSVQNESHCGPIRQTITQMETTRTAFILPLSARYPVDRTRPETLRNHRRRWISAVRPMKREPGVISHLKVTMDSSSDSERRVRTREANVAPESSDAAVDIPLSTARSLLGVVSHIQNHDLYSPAWADGARISAVEAKAPGGDATPRLVCSREGGADMGDVLSLYPIHALGLRGAEGVEDKDLVFYDVDRDGNFFCQADSTGKKQGGFGGGSGAKKTRKGKKGRRNNRPQTEKRQSVALRRDVVPLLLGYDETIRELFCSTDSEGDSESVKLLRSRLFVDVNPTRPSLPGWLGHLAKPASVSILNDNKDVEGNCVVLSLPGTAPLCALVATRPIELGEELVGHRRGALDFEELRALAKSTRERHEAEILELGGYVAIVLESPSRNKMAPGDGETAPSSSRKEPTFQNPFHSINDAYPGIRTLCSSPTIYAVDGFLTHSECDRLIAKAKPHLSPCLTKDPLTGEVKVDDRRTSTNANVPQEEVPTIVRKLLDLTGLKLAGEERLEMLQILRYKPGDQFREHTDGFDGPTTACGFENSGRIVTVFVYLNDVPKGGVTSFPEAGIDVVPKKGMAVVHFPSTVGFEEDERTVHAGMPAVDEKWLLTTWVWDAPRTIKEYAENRLPPLSNDLI